MQSLSLGTIALIEDATQLNSVVIRAEKSTVEIKLDKKYIMWNKTCWNSK
jgi:hypothetical protein